MLYPVKFSFKSAGEIKTFADKQNRGNLLPVDLTCKKCYKRFFREKENNMGQKLGSV